MGRKIEQLALKSFRDARNILNLVQSEGFKKLIPFLNKDDTEQLKFYVLGGMSDELKERVKILISNEPELIDFWTLENLREEGKRLGIIPIQNYCRTKLIKEIKYVKKQAGENC